MPLNCEHPLLRRQPDNVPRCHVADDSGVGISRLLRPRKHTPLEIAKTGSRIREGALLIDANCRRAIALTFIVVFRSDIQRIHGACGNYRFPGGELSASQVQRSSEVKPSSQATLTIHESRHPTERPVPQFGASRSARCAFRAERSWTYRWEYRYVNLFLVPFTQHELDWLASRKESATYPLYDSLFTEVISSAEERKAAMNALAAHISFSSRENASRLPQGYEFIPWRGPRRQTSASA